MKGIIYLIILLIVAGCAGTKRMKGYSQNIALHLDQLESEIERFSNARDALAKARMRNMLTLDQSTLEFRQDQELMRYILNSLDDKRAHHYDEIIQASDIIAQNEESFKEKQKEHEKIIKDARAKLNFRSDKINDLQKVLLQYSKKSTYKDEVNFYIGFFNEVRSNVKESMTSLDSLANQEIKELEITNQ